MIEYRLHVRGINSLLTPNRHQKKSRGRGERIVIYRYIISVNQTSWCNVIQYQRLAHLDQYDALLCRILRLSVLGIECGPRRLAAVAKTHRCPLL